MPGVVVHGPLIFALMFVGLCLCGPHPMLRPLLLVWALGGLYLGRDVAILCHYSPLLSLVCWAACGVVFFRPAPIARLGAAHAWVSAGLSLGLATILFLVASRRAREEDAA